MYALCVCKGLNMLLCSALSMQTMLNKQNNIKQLVTHTKQGINIHAKAYKVIAMQRLYYVYVLLYALIDLYVYGFT